MALLLDNFLSKGINNITNLRFPLNTIKMITLYPLVQYNFYESIFGRE